MIFCSENCTYENDGLCTLKEVTTPSETPIEDCPYFQEKQKKRGNKSSHDFIQS